MVDAGDAPGGVVAIRRLPGVCRVFRGGALKQEPPIQVVGVGGLAPAVGTDLAHRQTPGVEAGGGGGSRPVSDANRSSAQAVVGAQHQTAVVTLLADGSPQGVAAVALSEGLDQGRLSRHRFEGIHPVGPRGIGGVGGRVVDVAVGVELGRAQEPAEALLDHPPRPGLVDRLALPAGQALVQELGTRHRRTPEDSGHPAGAVEGPHRHPLLGGSAGLVGVEHRHHPVSLAEARHVGLDVGKGGGSGTEGISVEGGLAGQVVGLIEGAQDEESRGMLLEEEPVPGVVAASPDTLVAVGSQDHAAVLIVAARLLSRRSYSRPRQAAGVVVAVHRREVGAHAVEIPALGQASEAVVVHLHHRLHPLVHLSQEQGRSQVTLGDLHHLLPGIVTVVAFDEPATGAPRGVDVVLETALPDHVSGGVEGPFHPKTLTLVTPRHHPNGSVAAMVREACHGSHGSVPLIVGGLLPDTVGGPPFLDVERLVVLEGLGELGAVLPGLEKPRLPPAPFVLVEGEGAVALTLGARQVVWGAGEGKLEPAPTGW